MAFTCRVFPSPVLVRNGKGQVAMARILVLLALPLIALGIWIKIVKSNPELYKVMPRSVVEGDVSSRIRPGMGVGIEEVVSLPQSDSRPRRINYSVPYPNRQDRLLYNDMGGTIGLIEAGFGRELPFFDAKAHFGGRFKGGNLELGLISFTFHPEFATPGSAGEGKIYTVHSERPSMAYRDPAIPYFGLVVKKPHHLSVLSEWKVILEEPVRIDVSSQRVVLVLEQPYYDHNVYHIAFNPTSVSGDPDHGMLYVGVGSGGRASRLELDDKTLFGKILRIDPLIDTGPGYHVPMSNPYANSGGLRPEVWAYGLRNPQQFSWDPISKQMYAVDIGHSNIEEINIIRPGKNYGWSNFEGQYLISAQSFDIVEKSLLPLALFPVAFPVADYDHTYGKAIAGGFVYWGEDIPELQGHYVFGDIVNGRLFYFDSNGVGPGDRPELYELNLFDKGHKTSMAELVGGDRVDLRFALDDRGELLLVNKRDNIIRRITKLVR
jgi:glucose/sorbosone dehydrogenase